MREEQNFKTFDGETLFLVRETVSKPRGAVVIVHGLCEHQGRYDYVAQRLLAQQLNVYRFDHRGHGKSGGKRVYYEKWTDISDDVNAVVDFAKAQNPDLPLFVLGHSMGGYAAACFGTRWPGKADGLILSGAMTRYNAKIMGELPLQMSADTYVANALGEGVCSDPAVGAAYLADPLVEKQISVALINSLGQGVAYLKAHPKEFTDPVLVLHGLNDGLVSNLDSREFFGEIASRDKSLRIYSGMCHEIFNEYDKDEPIGDLIGWLNRRLAPAR
jgi:alpha-beta hydrolase superfamily lysophospholipase